jgi:hypothetical protein
MERTWLSSKRTAMPSCAGEEDDLVAVGDAHGDQFVALFDVDGVDAVGAHVQKSRSSVFLTVPLRVAKKTYLPSSSRLRTASMVLDGFAGLQADQIADVFAFAGGADVGNFVDLEPVDAALVGEDENVGVRRGDEEMLDEIFVARLHAGAARASAALHAVGGNGRALHVAGVADGDGDLLVGDQIFENDFGGFVFDAVRRSSP